MNPTLTASPTSSFMHPTRDTSTSAFTSLRSGGRRTRSQRLALKSAFGGRPIRRCLRTFRALRSQRNRDRQGAGKQVYARELRIFITIRAPQTPGNSPNPLAFQRIPPNHRAANHLTALVLSVVARAVGSPRRRHTQFHPARSYPQTIFQIALPEKHLPAPFTSAS